MSLARKIAAMVLFVVVLLLVDYLLAEYDFKDIGFGDYEARVVRLIGISITLAVSLNLINGITGQFSIGHAGFMAVGGYTACYVTKYFGSDIAALFGGTLTDYGGSIVLPISLLCGAGAAALAGLAVGIPSLRLRGDYLAIVTLGFGEIIRVAILNIESVGGALGFSGVPKLTTFFWIYLVAVLTVVIVRNITTSTFGRALTAIRDDEIAAEAMGVATTRYKVMAFVISSALAGVAGGLLGHHFGDVLNPQNLNFVKSIEIIIMIVIGGIGSITGAILGAVVLTSLPELLRDFDQAYPGLRMVCYALVLVLMMIFRPQGILGRREFNFNWLRRLTSKESPPAGA